MKKVLTLSELRLTFHNEKHPYKNIMAAIIQSYHLANEQQENKNQFLYESDYVVVVFSHILKALTIHVALGQLDSSKYSSTLPDF